MDHVELDFDRSPLSDPGALGRHLIEIPDLTPPALSPQVLPIARRAWEARAASEYIGVMVVRRFHGLLVDVNAPTDLQELALSMMLQEQQHTALCVAAARSLGSSGSLSFSLEELQRPRTSATVDEQLIEMIVSAYCVGEVVALALIRHSIEVLPPSPYRDILRRIAKDEVLHGRIGAPLLRLVRSEGAARWLAYPGDEAVHKISAEAVRLMRGRDVVEADEAALFEDPRAAEELRSVGIPPSPGFRAEYHRALDVDVARVFTEETT